MSGKLAAGSRPGAAGPRPSSPRCSSGATVSVPEVTLQGAVAPAEAGTPQAWRVLVVDDHEIVRRGLAALLDHRAGFRVVGQVGTAAEAVAAAHRLAPDLVVMDVRLPDGSGTEATRDIRATRPATKVVMLTGYADEEAIIAAVLAGATGYLLKGMRGRDLVVALEAVARGESLLDPTVVSSIFDRVRRVMFEGSADPVARLTRHEQEVLLCIAEGKTNRETASELGLAPAIVKRDVSSILSKLHLQRRAQAAAFVAHHRLPDAE